MAAFNQDQIELFLGVVRKYMQVRGPMTQKELADMIDVGVSTMSRFLGQKTSELNPQMIAKIVAVLNIPLHEIIDFVEEDYTERFVRLVKFYKDETMPEGSLGDEGESDEFSEPTVTKTQEVSTASEGQRRGDAGGGFEDEMISSLAAGTAKRSAKARIRLGGKTREIPFNPDQNSRQSEMSLKEKLASLSPRQKAYMTDFLNLDMEGRDLIVDIGNNLFRYFKHKGVDF